MPRIQTADGTELFYRDWGMLLSSDMWQYQMLHVSENGFRALA